MMINQKIHQIRINFDISKEIKRFVYVYLITGKCCYLIDSGIKGSEKIIASYMQGIGRNINEIKAIFLTHSHPDHIGGAARIKQLTGCQIYACDKTKRWSENIDLQFKKRPIPNFYHLVDQSIIIDKIIDSNKIHLESQITILPISTPGHSNDSTSYLFLEEKTIFIGDIIPVLTDLPIIVNYSQSLESLNKLLKLNNINYYAPAWDQIYSQSEIGEVIKNGKIILKDLYTATRQLDNGNLESEQLVSLVAAKLKMNKFIDNPLFKVSVLACR